MLSKMSTILRSLDRDPNKKIKILCCPTHESSQTNMSYIPNIEWYMVTDNQRIKQWNFNLKPLPSNFYYYNIPIDNMRGDVDFDLIMSNERFGQLPILLNIARGCKLPILHHEHTSRIPTWGKVQFENIKQMRADRHTFISDFSKKAWEGNPEDQVIRNMIHDEIFKGWTGTIPRIVTICNLIHEREQFCGGSIWNEVASQFPHKLIGENPGISQPAKNTKELVNDLAQSRIYVNTSIYSPFPMSLGEAMMVGMPIVSTAHQEVPNVLTHGVDAFLTNDPKEMIKYCEVLMKDDELCKKMGMEARKTALKFFSKEEFINKWTKVFREMI